MTSSIASERLSRDLPSRVPWLAILAAAIGLVSLACGEDEMTLEQYYAEVSRVTGDADQRIQAFAGQFSAGFADLETAKEVYPQYVEAYQDFVDDIEALEPPTLVREAHTNFLDASTELQAQNIARLERLSTAQDDSALAVIFGADEEYSAAARRQNEACVALREHARGRGIPVPGLANCEET
jgi:hypothetical protein